MSDCDAMEYEFQDSQTGGDWGDARASTEDLFERPAVKERPVILTRADVMAEVEKAVSDVVSVLAWSRTSALLMLRHCKWSSDIVKERYFDDPDQLVKASGVADMDDRFTLSDCSTDCGMCWESCDAGKAASLFCCHPFCFDCWQSHLEYHLRNSGSAAVAVRCPNAGCPQFCGRQAFETIFGASSTQLGKYDEYIITTFVLGNERYRDCPAPGCSLVARYPTGRSALTRDSSAPVVCKCGFVFCFVCGLEDHSPATCAMMTWWLKKEQDESETANWITANTKACPGKNCGKIIEKNGGCNHMTCSQCRYEWCWVCEGPWSEHGSSYYKCNYFKEDDKQKMRDQSRTNAQSELQRYIHYYSRYQNHSRSRRLDKVVLERTQARIAHELASTTQSILDLDYLTTTANVLNACRHTLMYTYVFAFYLADAKTKDLFEYNQSQLEYWTELLSEYIEDTSGSHSRQEVINRTSTADRMLKKLQEGCVNVAPTTSE